MQSALSLLAAQAKYGVAAGHQGLGVVPRAQRPRGRAHRPQRHRASPTPASRPTRAATALPDPGSVVAGAAGLRPHRLRAADRQRRTTGQGPGDLKPAQGFDTECSPPTCWQPRKGMSNALRGLRRAHRERPPGRRLRPADRLLRAAAADAGGAPGPGHQRPRRRLRRPEPVRANWAAARTTPGAPPPPSQDITDTYAVAAVQRRRLHAHHRRNSYLYHGTCTPMEKLERTNSWKPDPRRLHRGRLLPDAGRTAPSTAWSTDRATVGGKPVAYTSLRSSYLHEADSIIGFQMLNDPTYVHDAATFQQRRAAHQLHVQLVLRRLPAHRVLQRGNNPVRAAGRRRRRCRSRRRQRTSGRAATRPPTPPTYTPPAAAPAVGRPGLLRLLEQQAGQGLHRRRLRRRLGAPGRPAGRPGEEAGRSRAASPASALAKAMEDAALTDLRGEDVLPDLLAVHQQPAGHRPAPGRGRRRSCQPGRPAGAKRRETSAGSHTYADADAIRIMDAWWPLLVKARVPAGAGRRACTPR